MPNSNLVDVVIVLDRSGSMDSVKADTIGGFNAFLADQKKAPGEARLTLVQFDDQYEAVHSGKPVREVPDLTDHTYQPRGSTALLDAIGRTIDETGARLSALPEAQRPAKVILLVMTDGFENASHKYTRQQVFAKITEQREVYKWEVLFIGANQDAIAEGGRLGVVMSASLNYAATPDSVKAAYAVNSRKLSNMRAVASSGGQMSWKPYTDEERTEVLGQTSGRTK